MTPPGSFVAAERHPSPPGEARVSQATHRPAGLDLARVYAEHRGTIFKYLLRRTGDVDRAEDLTQDVFADAVATLPRIFQRHRPLLPWLYTVARRKAIDAARAERAAQALELGETTIAADDSKPDPRAIARALEHLPLPQRLVVLMRLFEGRSFAEIGDALGVSESACRMRFSRALSVLRERLEQAGVAVLALACEVPDRLDAIDFLEGMLGYI